MSEPEKALELLGLRKWPMAGGERGEMYGPRTPLQLGLRLVEACDGEAFRDRLYEVPTVHAAKARVR